MADRILKKDDLGRLIDAVREGGGLFIAPAMQARQVVFRPVADASEMATDYVLARNSFKEFLFPQTEVVADFTIHKDRIDVMGAEVEGRDIVVFGARPCDAATVKSLRSVFTWDFVDEFYTRREDRTVVIAIGCTKADDACFCTTVDMSPASTEGSDVYLRQTGAGDYIAAAITDRGRAFMEKYAPLFAGAQEGADLMPLVDPPKIDGVALSNIKKRLSDTRHYDEPVWAEMTRKCVGCGACTFVCPTCHCFDITDEGGAFSGQRRKNWDSCQYDSFTLHASGHNPRDTQYRRWRNRFMCKFNFYPEKFSSRGCVGCGRCVRVCPVRLDITEAMIEMSKEAE